MISSLKRGKPLRRTSKRRRGYSALRAQCMRVVRARSGGNCENRTPVCTGRAVEGHEPLKRSQGGDPTDPAQVLDSCRACNSWLETAEGRRWGIEHGKVIERRSLLALGLLKSEPSPSPRLALGGSGTTAKEGT